MARWRSKLDLSRLAAPVKPVPDAIGMRIEELLMNHSAPVRMDDLEDDKLPRRNPGSTETTNPLCGSHVILKRLPSFRP